MNGLFFIRTTLGCKEFKGVNRIQVIAKFSRKVFSHFFKRMKLNAGLIFECKEGDFNDPLDLGASNRKTVLNVYNLQFF